MRTLRAIEFERFGLLTQNQIEATLIETTKTGLEKSILDATGPVRMFLKEKAVHNYEMQRQGPEHKIQVQAFLITEKQTNSVASLYRPLTKNGDPRIWFKDLGKIAGPNDIIAIIEFQAKLFVVNISSTDIESLLNDKGSNAFKDLVLAIQSVQNLVADELLEKLKAISAKGPIPASLQADTAVGRTLEDQLNLPINSSKNPDYKGIELKSFRDNRGNRKNLFAQVPDWSLSKMKSAQEILDNFGYLRGETLKLYCTISTVSRNSQGLMLRMDNQNNLLYENSNRPLIGDFAVWVLELLHSRLLHKHKETFWIAAEPINIAGKEHFHYKKVEHTQKPIPAQFDILLGQGLITVDHLIKRTTEGKVNEKGPLFKLAPKALGLLFPPSQVYHL